jgi:hypothetical protein
MRETTTGNKISKDKINTQNQKMLPTNKEIKNGQSAVTTKLTNIKRAVLAVRAGIFVLRPKKDLKYSNDSRKYRRNKSMGKNNK